MDKPQFSLRAMLFATFLAGVTFWLARQLAAMSGHDDLATHVSVIVVAFAIGPAGFAWMGYLAGQEAGRPWRGAIACALLVLFGWLLFLYWPS
jgi:hypothetical protein